MFSAYRFPATTEDLYDLEGKAELIRGMVVRFPPMGCLPAEIAGEIAFRLHEHAQCRGGIVFTRSLAYVLDRSLRSGRQSISPDASFYVGPLPANRMRFVEGPPTFAVEVRSENDYTPAAQREMAEKRADYFEAGTLVVWDVDPIARTIASYRNDSPLEPTMFKAGDIANAEPAVPGWTMPVNDLFGPAVEA